MDVVCLFAVCLCIQVFGHRHICICLLWVFAILVKLNSTCTRTVYVLCTVCTHVLMDHFSPPMPPMVLAGLSSGDRSDGGVPTCCSTREKTTQKS